MLRTATTCGGGNQWRWSALGLALSACATVSQSPGVIERPQDSWGAADSAADVTQPFTWAVGKGPRYLVGDPTVALDLPADRRGRTLVVVTRSSSIDDARARVVVLPLVAGGTSKPSTGEPVPVHVSNSGHTEHTPVVAPIVCHTPLAGVRMFNVPIQRGEHTVIAARLRYAGDVFAFYSQVGDPELLSATELRRMDAVMTTGYYKTEGLLPILTDTDANCRIVILLSSAFQRANSSIPEQQAVDACNILPHIPDCRPDYVGEIVYASAPTAVLLSESRELTVENIFPRTTLHEVIHISQLALARRLELTSAPAKTVPPELLEGEAEMSRFVDCLGIRPLLASVFSGGTTGTASMAYARGAALSWWLQFAFGPDIHRELLTSFMRGDADPWRTVLGRPEGLAVAEMYMQSRKNPSWFYRGACVPRGTRSAAPGLDVVVVHPGDTATLEPGSRSHGVVLVEHTEPVVVNVTSADGSIVVLADTP